MPLTIDCNRRLCATALALASAGALATEGGGTSYSMGVETNYNGLMLPEGLHPFAYYSHYEASHSKDNSGNDNARLAYFGLRSDVVAGRLSYVWRGVRLFGATVETRVVQAVASVKLSLGVSRPPPAGSLDRSGSRTGLADTAFSPIVLGWHCGAREVHTPAYVPRRRMKVARVKARLDWLNERWASQAGSVHRKT